MIMNINKIKFIHTPGPNGIFTPDGMNRINLKVNVQLNDDVWFYLVGLKSSVCDIVKPQIIKNALYDYDYEF